MAKNLYLILLFLPGIIIIFLEKFFENYLLIKYEDLEKHPEKTFSHLIDYLNSFLKIKINSSKINEIIKLNSFENLQNIENTSGFKEASIDEKNEKKKFFYLGPKNRWNELLPKDIKEKIEKNFKTEMKVLKYL